MQGNSQRFSVAGRNGNVLGGESLNQSEWRFRSEKVLSTKRLHIVHNPNELKTQAAQAYQALHAWADDAGKKILHFNCHLSSEVMGGNQHWAAVLSVSPMDRLDAPYAGSAAAVVNGITYCSTILPWRGVKSDSPPCQGSNHAEMTKDTIKTLLKKLPKSQLVWGGDWNHSLIGKEHAGSMGGRTHVLEAIQKLGLNVPTTCLSHRGDYCQAIDHIGVPLSWTVESAKRIKAEGLSDHDA